jgi:hypothetical protein
MIANDLTGQRFGLLVADVRSDNTKAGRARWECVCDCGNRVIVTAANLRAGNVKSCGCLRKNRLKTHGEEGTRLNRIWKRMKTRCNNTNTKDYPNYGARGIKVCKEWSDSYESFRDWALANGYQDHLTIERKDTNGNYSPENCCWITKAEQARNRRNLHFITANGETHTIAEWERITGIQNQTIQKRIRDGWSEEDAVLTPVAACKEGLNHG